MLQEGNVKFPCSWTEELFTEFIFVKILDVRVSLVLCRYADILSLFMRVFV
jgi:hypothetical protein